MLKKGKCMYCAEETNLEPVEIWNIPGKFKYYCQTHYFEVLISDEKDKQAFIDYYRNETTRSWLCTDGLKLYNRLTQNNPASS